MVPSCAASVLSRAVCPWAIARYGAAPTVSGMALPIHLIAELPDIGFTRAVTAVSTYSVRTAPAGPVVAARMSPTELRRRTQKAGVEDTAFIAAHAVDSEFLADLLARDKRKGVRAALASNAHFPAEVFAAWVTDPGADFAQVRSALDTCNPRVLVGAIAVNPDVAPSPCATRPCSDLLSPHWPNSCAAPRQAPGPARLPAGRPR